MAKVPGSQENLKSHFGPHLNYTPPGGWKGESGKQDEKLSGLSITDLKRQISALDE